MGAEADGAAEELEGWSSTRRLRQIGEHFRLLEMDHLWKLSASQPSISFPTGCIQNPTGYRDCGN
jgi:hypothetical protein